jgi:hypothetical protein
MVSRVRPYARRLLGVVRVPTYYLPWLTRPGLECTVLINDVESRFRPAHKQRALSATITQYDADGSVVAVYEAALHDSVDVREVKLTPTTAGLGFVTVATEGIHSDLYVALSHGETYSATHGRHEFIERYPARTRALLSVAGGILARAGRTLPVFRRDQYVYRRPEGRTHVLVMNLSNVTNGIRVVGSGDGAPRLLALPPMGSRLLDVGEVGGAGVSRLHLEGNAWFNIYLVGAGPRDLAGPLSLMHVK